MDSIAWVLVVAQALSATQAPEIQSRLHEMQRKLSTVQGSITVSTAKPRSPEHVYSEYHESKASKPPPPLTSNTFEPKQMTEEEM